MKRLFLASLLLLCACGKPKDPVTTFLDATVAGNADEAQALMCYPQDYDEAPVRVDILKGYTVLKDEVVKRNEVDVRVVTIEGTLGKIGADPTAKYEIWEFTPETLKRYNDFQYKKALSLGVTPPVLDIKEPTIPKCVVAIDRL